MTNSTPGDDRPINDQDLRLLDLLAQFIGLSDDTENAGRIMLLGSTGRFIGDCTLSADDIEAAADALLHLNIRRADQAAGLEPAEPLLDMDADDAADLIAETEAFLANGGLA